MRGLSDVFYSIAHEVCSSICPSLLFSELFIYKLRDNLTKNIKAGQEEFNMLDWMSRAALEYIGQGGLGYSFDALDRTKANAYADSIKLLL